MKSRRHRLHLAASRIHKWLALLIGAQLLIWFASGFIMSLLPIERVRGEHLVDTSQEKAFEPGQIRLSPAAIVSFSAQPVRGLRYTMLLDRAVVEVEGTDGSTRLLDAATGATLPRIDEAMAEKVARSVYRAAPAPASVKAVDAETTEYRGELPAWQVAFEDEHSTSIYVTRDTGQVAAVRTGTWRFYDFMWGLHIMDWKNHEDFNTPWLLAFASGALVLGLAGVILLIMRWPGRFRRAARRKSLGSAA
jgi:hypothetical protein